jgi:DNA-binding CsgD family transcriptional regulator
MVCPIALTELVTAAVESLLRPYSSQVTFAKTWRRDCDVGLVDPELVPGTWHEDTGVPLVAVRRDAAAGATRRAQELGAVAVVGPDLTGDELLLSIERARRQSTRSGELSAREAEVLTLICHGLSNRQISQQLFLSPNSVKTYIRTAYRKMGVSSRSQAILWGIHRGLNPDAEIELPQEEAASVQAI